MEGNGGNEQLRLRRDSKDKPNPLFRKSISIDPPSLSDVERPQSQQSSRSKRSKISSFFSNLFGHSKSVDECESPPPSAPPQDPPRDGGQVSKSGKVKLSASRESVNSVLSSESFSYVTPKIYRGKPMKGKRIPVDDPNYGVVKQSEKKGIGGAFDKIGAKIGLKKKYNLQSCESLQYIDACCDDDEQLSIAAKIESSIAAGPSTAEGEGSGNEERSQGQSSSTGQTETLPQAPPVSLQLKAECDAITKLFSSGKEPEAVASVTPETSSPKSLPPVDRKEEAKVEKVVPSKSPPQSPKVIKCSLQEDSPRQPKIVSAPTSMPALQANLQKQAESSPPTTPKAQPDSVTASSKPLPATTSTSTVTIAPPTTLPPSISELPPSISELPPPTAAQQSNISAVPSKPVHATTSTSTVTISLPTKLAPLISESPPSTSPPTASITTPPPTSITLITKTTTTPSQSSATSSPSTSIKAPPPTATTSSMSATSTSSETNSPKASTPKPSTPPDSSYKAFISKSSSPPPAAPAKPSPMKQSELPVNEPTPSTSKASASPTPPTSISPVPSSSKLLLSGNSNTWSNSNRRKRRAPLPPSFLADHRNEDIPNGVPSSSSQAASLLRFQRLEGSPSRSTTGTFEIRPRKKEWPPEGPSSRGREGRPNSFVNSPSNSLFSLNNHRYHVRASSESRSVNTKYRVHKPGKKKAPPPPNPFGDPEEPETSSAKPSTSTSAAVVQVSTKKADKPPVCTPPAVDNSAPQPTLPPTPPQQQERMSDSPPVSVSTTQTRASVEVTSSTPTVSSHAEVLPPQQETTCLPPTTTCALDSPPPDLTDYSADEIEEIRQNILNDQQERQQQSSEPSVSPPETSNTPSTDPPQTPSLSSSSASTRPAAASENDLQAARRTLDVLSASVSTTSSTPQKQPTATTSTDPNARAKLHELKLEAERSPFLNGQRKSRPASMGSSIYESPLALLLGRGSNNATSSPNTENQPSSAESSPRVTPKPWYKRSTAAAALGSKFSSKSKQTSSVKPFSALVKFSELDKEAARIVEENRRKSAEQRFNENAQELIALFADNFDESAPAGGSEDQRSSSTSEPVPTSSHSSSLSMPAHVKVTTTTAQVHPITEETDDAISSIPPDPPTSPPPDSPPLPHRNTSGSASPPTFQSVHAASKHRLLTGSPGSKPKVISSDKLAIVQPQASSTRTPVSASSSSTSPTVSPPIVATPSAQQQTSESSPQVSNPTSATLTSAHPTTTTTTTSTSLPTLTTSSAPLSQRTSGEEWDCPRCTLKNPSWRILCEICFTRKNPVASSGFMSSIFQRVNAQSANKSSTSTTTTTTTPSSTVAARVSSMTQTSSVPLSTTPIPNAVTSAVTSNNIPEPPPAQQPPSENLLSELPAKQDPPKEKMLGIKLHEDPDLEDLDVSKLREVRLAYFQQRTTSQSESTAEPTSPPPSRRTNDLGANCSSSNGLKPAFTSDDDDDDDFIDAMLELNEQTSTNVANISQASLPGKQSATSSPTSGTTTNNLVAPSESSNVPPPSSPCATPRFRPRLEAIREGNSQDYSLCCYSSTEIAQIYENWQRDDDGNNEPPQPLPRHSLATSPMAQRSREEIHKQTHRQRGGMVDHQPLANNRSSHSPDENYVNTVPPTLGNPGDTNECANFTQYSSPPPPQICYPSFAHLRQMNGVFVNNNGSLNRNYGQPLLFPYQYANPSGSVEYENSMSLTQGGPGSSRRWRPQRPEDCWSTSESSCCDTDSSRGMSWGRGVMQGYLDAFQGMSRRGPLDFSQSQENGMPVSQSSAVAKLMRRLEAAIATGDHRLAATLAHDLALMKVDCVVAKINQPFSLRVYVEDRFMQQGPFLIQVSSMMTVRELKAKIEADWGIPSPLQKWILGRKMAENDNESLSSFDMTQDSMGFLFLVTPELGGVSTLPSSGVESKTSNLRVSTSPKPCSSRVMTNGRASQSPTMQQWCNGNLMLNISNDPGASTHVYNNLTENIKKTTTPPPPEIPAKPKPKESAGTPKVNSPPANLQKTNEVEQEEEKPPLPCRSPLPNPVQKKKEAVKQQNKELNTTTTPNVTTSSPAPSSQSTHSKPQPVKNSKPKSKECAGKPPNCGPKETKTQKPGPPSTTAEAITMSLQQKLAEFKAVAEQTFGRSIATSNQSSKEQSPAPPNPVPGGSKSKEKSSAKKVINTGFSSQSSSKEKLSHGGGGSSTEKLKPQNSQEEPIKENRFNGILLPTPNESGDIKPPERSDKSKDSSKAKSPMLEANQDEKVAIKAEASTSTTQEFVKRALEEENSKPPPVPRDKKSPTPKPSPSIQPKSLLHQPSADEKVKEQKPPVEAPEEPVPLPKPRGLKKQQSVERTLEEPPPKPVPRTAGAGRRASSESRSPDPLGAKLDKSGEPPPLPPPVASIQSKEEGPPPQLPPKLSSPAPSPPGEKPASPEPSQSAVADDGCQTTLPFPKPRFTAAVTVTESSTASLPPPAATETQTTDFRSLLRPSAFFGQQSSSSLIPKTVENFSTSTSSSPPKGPTSSSVLFPILNATPTQGQSQLAPNIAHVRPFPGKPFVSPPLVAPPTVTVAPTPATSSGSTTTASGPLPPPGEKSKEESTTSNQSFLSMLELMEKQDLIYTCEETECPVCFMPVVVGEGIVLRDCLHSFCKECLVGCVQYADESTVKCPYRDNDYSCNYNLQEREIKALVPSEIFEKYLARSVKLAESAIVNTFHCKTPDCSGWCVFEDDVNTFLCPVCKIRNCLTCAAIHEGTDCLKYQRELAIAAETDEDAKQSRLMLEKMIQRGEALECPACHVVLLKKWGCDWVRCSYCKTEICWVTKGFRWGKGGKGDVSGGCKCGVNGVKCHPKCTYCH